MSIESQPISQFLILTALGLVLVAWGVALVADFRGMATRRATRLSKSWQSDWYQRLFVWTDGARQLTSDERAIRRRLRQIASGMIAMGTILLVFEVSALIRGHVG